MKPTKTPRARFKIGNRVKVVEKSFSTLGQCGAIRHVYPVSHFPSALGTYERDYSIDFDDKTNPDSDNAYPESSLVGI